MEYTSRYAESCLSRSSSLALYTYFNLQPFSHHQTYSSFFSLSLLASIFSEPYVHRLFWPSNALLNTSSLFDQLIDYVSYQSKQIKPPLDLYLHQLYWAPT